MANVASSSDQVADSLGNLSLDSQTMTTKVPEPAKKDNYGDNGSLMYQQGYGYMAYGAYPSPNSPLPTMGQDLQFPMLQEYHYPGAYYPPPAQTSWPSTPNGSASQVEVSTSGSADQASLSVDTNKGNPSPVANGGNLTENTGSRPLRPTFQKSSLNPNASYNRGGMPAGYQDPRFNYDAIQAAMPWLDASMSSSGQSKHAASSGFPSHTSNTQSGRNQNLHYFPQYMNLHNARPTSGLGQAYGYINHIYANSMTYGHYGNSVRANSGLGSYGYDSWKKGHGWYAHGNNNKSRGRGYGKENMDGLSELNRGPRVKGYKNQDGFGPVTLAVKEQNLSLSENNKENKLSLIPDMEQYNKEDFPENYPDAKFFVIKSYSEDDVHKSVKYGVWASTSNGNKKLDAAYHEAKEKPNGGPVFLLFSVNTSGQFVGLAEMVGPVDFNKTVEYWQQDKWIGCFPVKWHIVKDVPNSSLRHITLENNENKPVTNSRDTQEVNLEQGIQIIKIFKSHSSKTCILDDFEFYETRQKIMQEKKSKHQLLQKQVSGEPNDGALKDNNEKAEIGKEIIEKSIDAAIIEEPTGAGMAAETVKMNGEVKLVEENGAVAAGEDAPAKPVCVASAC